jgi:hypothetical protein
VNKPVNDHRLALLVRPVASRLLIHINCRHPARPSSISDPLAFSRLQLFPSALNQKTKPTRRSSSSI